MNGRREPMALSSSFSSSKPWQGGDFLLLLQRPIGRGCPGVSPLGARAGFEGARSQSGRGDCAHRKGTRSSGWERRGERVQRTKATETKKKKFSSPQTEEEDAKKKRKVCPRSSFVSLSHQAPPAMLSRALLSGGRRVSNGKLRKLGGRRTTHEFFDSFFLPPPPQPLAFACFERRRRLFLALSTAAAASSASQRLYMTRSRRNQSETVPPFFDCRPFLNQVRRRSSSSSSFFFAMKKCTSLSSLFPSLPRPLPARPQGVLYATCSSCRRREQEQANAASPRNRAEKESKKNRGAPSTTMAPSPFFDLDPFTQTLDRLSPSAPLPPRPPPPPLPLPRPPTRWTGRPWPTSSPPTKGRGSSPLCGLPWPRAQRSSRPRLRAEEARRPTSLPRLPTSTLLCSPSSKMPTRA